jgi:hypothetical protein
MLPPGTCEVGYVKALSYEPEGICEVPWWAELHVRHHCENAAVCELVIHDEPYLSCAVCRDELIGLGAIRDTSRHAA